MATQNPIEMEGTYPLPEAQLDRFLMKILVAYPSRTDLSRIVELTTKRDEAELRQVLDRKQIADLKAICRQVIVAPHVQDYAIDLVMATQPGTAEAPEITNRYIRYGSSPRGAQALIECGRVLALMRGRMHLRLEDVAAVAPARAAPSHDSEFRRACGRRKHRNDPDEDSGTRLRKTVVPSQRELPDVMPEPLVDRHFLERLERLTLHWQKSFQRAGRRP